MSKMLLRGAWAFAFAWACVGTGRAYAETIHFSDPLAAPLRFDQVNDGMGNYAWDGKSADSTRLTAPPLVEGKREAVEKHFLGLSWFSMTEVPGDPNVKMEHAFGSIGALDSSFALIKNRRHPNHETPEGYQTGMNDKKSGGTYAAFRLKF